MTTATKTAPAPAKRYLKVIATDSVHGSHLIRLDVAGKAGTYHVDQTDGVVTWGELYGPGQYDVTDKGCTCDGWKYRGKCKHHGATAKLRQLGIVK